MLPLCRLDGTRKPDIPNSSQQSGVVSWLSHSRREGGGAWRPSASLRKWLPGERRTVSGCADPHSWRGGSGGPECCRSLAPGRSLLPWLQVRTTRCQGSMERHLTWPTCLGRCERRFLCARILIVDCSLFSCVKKKSLTRNGYWPNWDCPN